MPPQGYPLQQGPPPQPWPLRQAPPAHAWGPQHAAGAPHPHGPAAHPSWAGHAAHQHPQAFATSTAPARLRIANVVLAVVLVVALTAIGVALASPQTIRSAFAPEPVSTLPGGGTTAPRTTTSSGPTSGSTTTRTATPITTTPSMTAPPTGEQALSGNPILAAGGMPKQVCIPPNRPVDGPSGQAFYDAALPCVERAWQPLFERARMAYNPPNVLAPTGTTVMTPCGTKSTSEAAATYCPTNETIYMPIAGMPDGWTEGRPLNYLSVFAHEFGHHVQELTGILEEEWRREKRAGMGTPTQLELSRRTELQVQCFAGMFVESITDSGGPFTRSDIDHTRRFEYDSADSPTHGSAANVGGWWVRGLANNTANCNTWKASASEVA